MPWAFSHNASSACTNGVNHVHKLITTSPWCTGVCGRGSGGHRRPPLLKVASGVYKTLM